jgi:hypothetical protein
LHMLSTCRLLPIVVVRLTMILLAHGLVSLGKWLARMLHLTLLSELLQVRNLGRNLLGRVHLCLLGCTIRWHLSWEVLVLLWSQVLRVGVRLHF